MHAAYLIIHKDHPVHVQGVNSGAEMATLSLARYIAKLGRRVVVAAMLSDAEASYDGVQFMDLGPAFDVSSILMRMREFGEYHLISAGRALPLLMSRTEPLCLSRTLITHDRAGNDIGIKPEILNNVTDHIICVSQAQADVFVASGADPAIVRVVRNGADLELFSPGDPEKRNYRRLVFVGALVQDKGIHVLVNTFARLKNQFPDLVLDVYGSAGLWGRDQLFDEKAVERQLPGIRFHGKTPQHVIADAYRDAGICVIPSIWFDPFPLVALEAQVTGCPVVAFNVGGLGEGMIPGKSGILLDEISEDSLVQCLSQLIQDPAQLKAMSIEALRFARSAFTWERVADTVTGMCEAAHAQTGAHSHSKEGRIGFLSTWNQQCGLATYARFLVTSLPEGTYTVLAEDLQGAPTRPDETFVLRCWKRDNGDFSRIRDAVRRHNIRLLHLNCHARFFPQPSFGTFLRELQHDGVTVVAHLHTTFTLEPALRSLVTASSAVIVHTPENRLEAIANGSPPDKTFVIPHGVNVRPIISESERRTLRRKHGLPPEGSIITSFGFVQAHKGMEGLIEAVHQLNQAGVDCIGVIAGKSNDSDPGSAQYQAALKEFAQNLNVAGRIRFMDRFLDDEEVMEYLSVSDAVMMNYRSNYFEASGACALAIGARAVVAASLAPPFMCFEDAVFHITGGYPPALAVQILLTDPAVRAEVRRKADEYCEKHSWPQTGRKILSLYEQLGFRASAQLEIPQKDPSGGRVIIDGIYDAVDSLSRCRELVEKGTMAARAGNTGRAHELFTEARKTDILDDRALISQGALYLSEERPSDARPLFEEAISRGSRDPAAHCGLGMCCSRDGHHEQASRHFIEALGIDPLHLLSIQQLIASSSMLGKFSELEKALSRYTRERPNDTEMQYCHAGALLKEGRLDRASEVVDRLIQADSKNTRARELKGIIVREKALRSILGNPVQLPVNRKVQSTESSDTESEKAV